MIYWFILQTTDIFKVITELQEDKIHLPFGQPKLNAKVFQLRNVTRFHQETYTLAFDDYLNVPVWMSQTLNGTQLTVAYHLIYPPYFKKYIILHFRYRSFG